MTRIAVLPALAALAALVLFLRAPIPQDPAYHQFSDQRGLFGIPNFWNVASNAPFLLVAFWGLRALRNPCAFASEWERNAYLILLGGLGLVSFGSGYYHLWPGNDTLFWDRLPMTIVFMSLLAIMLGERVSPHAGRLLLAPFLVVGVVSLFYWKAADDLRLYVLVQFYPMLAVPLMLSLFPPRYTHSHGAWAMIGLYVAAKLLELTDTWIWASVVPLSGHAWKHVAGGFAMLCYVQSVASRKLMPGR